MVLDFCAPVTWIEETGWGFRLAVGVCLRHVLLACGVLLLLLRHSCSARMPFLFFLYFFPLVFVSLDRDHRLGLWKPFSLSLSLCTTPSFPEPCSCVPAGLIDRITHHSLYSLLPCLSFSRKGPLFIPRKITQASSRLRQKEKEVYSVLFFFKGNTIIITCSYKNKIKFCCQQSNL